MLEIERLRETARVGHKTLYDLMIKMQEQAARVYDCVEAQSQNKIPLDVFQINKLNDVVEQQEKNLKIYINLENIMAAKGEKRTHWGGLAGKERNILNDEALIKFKMTELEELKKERDHIRNLKEARHGDLLKEIAFYDETLKEQEDRHALKLKYQKEIEEGKVLIKIEKQKAVHPPEISIIRTVSAESVDLDEVLPPPIVFKNPNDFPILCELIRSPTIVKPNDVTQKAKVEKVLKKVQPKVILNRKNLQKSARLTRKNSIKHNSEPLSPRGTAKKTKGQGKVIHARKLSSKVDETPKSTLQNEAISIEIEIPVSPKKLAKKHKVPSAKQTPITAKASQSSTIQANKVPSSETFDIPDKINSEPQVKKVLSKSVTAVQETPKPQTNIVVAKSKVTESSKIQVKKVISKPNVAAQQPASNAKPKRNNRKTVVLELEKVCSDEMEVDQQAETSDEEEYQSSTQSVSPDKNIKDNEITSIIDEKDDDNFFNDSSNISTGSGDEIGGGFGDLFGDDTFNFGNNSNYDFLNNADNNEANPCESGFFI